MHHSGRVLQGLSFQPSGAIVAAATTSLPEGVGGERNWDYRYSWVRDASFTMEALWVAACPDEADDFFAFMTTAAASRSGPDQGLQIMFGIGGEHDLTERELPHLRGMAGQPPGPGRQRGLGPAADRRVRRAARRRAPARRPARRPSTTTPSGSSSPAPTRPRSDWVEKDQGIWEVRGDPQHFLYSKVMCWVALDRAIALADRLGAERSGRRRGSTTREQICETVVRDGWSEQAGAFTQYVGSTALDASNLMMAIVGFLPADDPRMLATIDAIEQRLTDERGLVYRYRTEDGVDGLAGEEGTFLLCTFWLAQALAMAGQVDRARACSSGPSRSSTTSGCSPRRWTRRPASCWATSRRRSATSAWSTPPGPSPRPSAGPAADPTRDLR